MSHVVKIKNPSSVARSIRPYAERGVLVTLQPNEIVNIDLKRCEFNVKSNPRQYFKNLGFIFDPAPEVKAKATAPGDNPPKVIGAEPPKNDAADASKTVETVAPVKVSTDKTKVSIVNGDIKHFHPGNKTWHTVRVVKEWAIGRVVYNETDKTYLKVSSVDGESLVGTYLSEEEALKLTGVKP